LERDLAVTVLIKDIESNFDVVLIRQSFSIDASAHELLEIDLTLSVLATVGDDSLPINGWILTETAVCHSLQVMLVDRALLAFVKADELSL
jgi:hypothetical protein